MLVAAYCRVSTDKEEQLSSLDNQRYFFAQYAAKCGDILVEVYADEGISGKSMKNRTAFTRMLNDASEKKFQCVLVKDISRFSRNTADFLYGIRTLRSYGVNTKFLTGNMTVLENSEFILTVFAALAQEESAGLSKRVSFGKRQNAKKGRVPNIIYGYDKTDKFTLVINQEESSVVKQIFKWYIDGRGFRSIAIKLNETGLTTKEGARWRPQTVRRILENPIYAGTLVNNKTVTGDFLTGSRRKLPENEWYKHDRPSLKIISTGDFEYVQKKMDQRRNQYKNNNPGHRYSGRHVFSNLIKCGECGKGYTAKIYKWKNTFVRYRCSCHKNSGNSCCSNSVTIDENELLGEIKKYLLSVIDDKKSFIRMLCAQQGNDSECTNIAYLENAKQKLENKKQKLKNMYFEDIISLDEMKADYAEAEKRIHDIDIELEKLNMSRKKIDKAKISLESLLMEAEFSNNDMRTMIEEIVVYPDKTTEIIMK